MEYLPFRFEDLPGRGTAMENLVAQAIKMLLDQNPSALHGAFLEMSNQN